MKLIPLTQGKFAKVDDEDFEWLSRMKWHCAHGYARSQAGGRKHLHHFFMHRLVTQAAVEFQVDHINGDGLDNRRCNLRVCTAAQNSKNIRISSRNRSGYKGVSWHGQDKRWVAKIRKDGKQYHLGLFRDPELAARAYDKAARELFGEYARLNFPDL